MRRIEQETAEQTQGRIRWLFEEIQARTRSRRDWKGVDMFSEEYQKAQRERDRERLLEHDQEYRRGLNRALLFSVSSYFAAQTGERFVFDRDEVLEGDVAYLSDLKFTGLFDHHSLSRKDQRKLHNRILLENENRDIVAIEFFNSKEAIDLAGITEAAKVKKQLADNVNVIIDPSRRPIRNLSTSA